MLHPLRPPLPWLPSGRPSPIPGASPPPATAPSRAAGTRAPGWCARSAGRSRACAATGPASTPWAMTPTAAPAAEAAGPTGSPTRARARPGPSAETRRATRCARSMAARWGSAAATAASTSPPIRRTASTAAASAHRNLVRVWTVQFSDAGYVSCTGVRCPADTACNPSYDVCQATTCSAATEGGTCILANDQVATCCASKCTDTLFDSNNCDECGTVVNALHFAMAVVRADHPRAGPTPRAWPARSTAHTTATAAAARASILSSDPSHCGACGLLCPRGEACTSSTCSGDGGGQVVLPVLRLPRRLHMPSRQLLLRPEHLHQRQPDLRSTPTSPESVAPAPGASTWRPTRRTASRAAPRAATAAPAALESARADAAAARGVLQELRLTTLPLRCSTFTPPPTPARCPPAAGWGRRRSPCPGPSQGRAAPGRRVARLDLADATEVHGSGGLAGHLADGPLKLTTPRSRT